ncbi:MAG: polysaccharide biosynthesis tyrosine autokinase [Solobacterium sp.]|nr:polysaccharide biosynthesis tyrosine autokinase [Solobacterium sp.]
MSNSTYRSSDTTPDKIDITVFLDDYLTALRKRWIIPVLLALILGLFSWFRVSTSYTPQYKAECTVSVSTSTPGNDSKLTAGQISRTFPAILTSGILSDRIAEDMGVSRLPGTIKVTNVSGTNFLTISVTGKNALDVYNELQTVIRVYPSIARYVVGETQFEIIEDSGVPEDSGKAVSMRGSILKYSGAGLAAGLLYVFLFMVTKRTVRNHKDLSEMVNTPYLGTLPVYRKKKRGDGDSGISILEENVQQDYLEAVRTVRTRLERRMKGTDRKVIMVTSSIPGEGKSTVAGNLAISFAGQGKKVILLDCDIRNPSQQEVLNIKGDYPGLEKVLSGEVKLSDALYSYEDRGFDLLCLLGAQDPSEHIEILGSEQMRKLIAMLREKADVIILDTPPSAMLADAMLMVKNADLAVYVIMCDYARRPVILRGITELNEAGVKIAGCVLNGGKHHNYGYGSYGYTSYQKEAENKEE